LSSTPTASAAAAAAAIIGNGGFPYFYLNNVFPSDASDIR